MDIKQEIGLRMHMLSGVCRHLGGLILAVILVGCTTTPGATPGGESAGEPPQPAPDTSDAEESDFAEMVWDEYPSDVGKFLEDVLPVLAVSLDLPFLNDPSCAEMPVWVSLENFGTSLPPSLGNEAVMANLGFLPWPRDTSLAEAALQETSALSRHCSAVVSADARYRSVVDAIPAYASEEEARRSVDAAAGGKVALVDPSFRLYLDERSHLDDSLRFVACYLRSAFPGSKLLLMENLQTRWQSEVLRAYQLSNFVRLESTGRSLIPASDLTEFWVEREWGSKSSFEAWLCGGP